MNNCYFCEVIKTNSYEIFFEHEHYTVLWDGTPSVPGHAMITPKRHVQYIEQLTDLEASELIPLARQIGGVVHNTDLEKIYTRMISLEPNQNRRDYYQNCLDKVRIYQRPPEAFNYGINDGPEAGQSVPHVHLHVIPRWSGDVENPKGGIRNMFSFDRYSQEP